MLTPKEADRELELAAQLPPGPWVQLKNVDTFSGK